MERDHPDLDDYAPAFMASWGFEAQRQGYSNAAADRLIRAAALALDPDKRKPCYYQLQDIYLDDAVAIIYAQQLTRRFVRDTVKGYSSTPLESGPFETLPSLSKGD